MQILWPLGALCLSVLGKTQSICMHPQSITPTSLLAPRGANLSLDLDQSIDLINIKPAQNNQSNSDPVVPLLEKGFANILYGQNILECI